MDNKFNSKGDPIPFDLLFLHSTEPQSSSNGKGKKKMIAQHNYSDNIMNGVKSYKKLEDEPKNDYGFESRTANKIEVKAQDKTMSRNRFVPDSQSMSNRVSRESSAPHTNLQSSRISQATSSRTKLERHQSEQELNLDAKIQPYKDHILALIRQNQSLKLKQKQTQIRASELQLKYQQQPQQPPNTITLIGKYQLPIRRAFQLYGYGRQQSSIDNCRSQPDIISFLIKFITDRWQQLSLKQEQARENISRDQREMSKIRDSLRMLMQTNELFKSREIKYKQKTEEIKKQLSGVLQKLKQAQNKIEQLESDKLTLQKSISQYEEEVTKMQKHKKQMMEKNQRQQNQLQSKIIEQSGEMSKYHMKCEQLQTEIEDYRETIEEWKLRCRVKDGQLERAVHDMHRWKERYENNGRVDMSKYQSKYQNGQTRYESQQSKIQQKQQLVKSDETMKIPPELKKNLFQTAPMKSLDPINQRSQAESSTYQNYSQPRSYQEEVNNSKQRHSDTETFNELQNVINALQKQFDKKIKK